MLNSARLFFSLLRTCKEIPTETNHTIRVSPQLSNINKCTQMIECSRLSFIPAFLLFLHSLFRSSVMADTPPPSTVHHEPSFGWFDSDGVGHHHDIELGAVDEWRPSIFSIESGIGSEGAQATEQTMPPVHLNVAHPSVEAIIAIVAMGSTIMVGILGLNFPINGDDGKHGLTALFHQHPMTFCFFVVIGVATFYFTAIGTILCRFRPAIARTLNLIALVLAVLAVTVLLWTLLPSKFGWVPWIFFALTILAASVVQACEWATRKSTDKIPCRYRDRFRCPTIHSPSVIIRNSSHQLLLNSWKCSPRLRRVRSSSL